MRRPPGRTVPGNRWDLLDGLWPETPPLVSIVVVHFRQPRQLERTLAALARQTHPADRLELLVVDDGSPDPPAVPAGVRLLRQEDRGFRAGAARNRGAREARGDVLCFLDADTTPEPDYVRRLTRLPAIAPEAVTVGRRAHADLAGVDPSAPIEDVAPARALPAPEWLARGYAASGDLRDADDRSYRFVISSVMACSRWFFDEVGGFDERFAEYGGEDWEWAHRAWLAGALLAHVPAALAWHDGPDWLGRDADEPARRAAKNRETLRLADAVPVPGSRGRAVRSAGTDVLVRLPATASAAAAYVCVDGVLDALPEATVVVPDAAAPVFAADARIVPASGGVPPGVRVVVDVERLVRVHGPGLRAAVDRLAVDGLGSLVLTDGDGATLVRLTASRAAARERRWGRDDLFGAATEHAGWLEPITQEPDVEAHLGGWD